MFISDRDEKAGRIEIRIEDPDDLWHLFNLVRPGDRVFSVTHRREERAADAIREKRAEKRTIYLGILVEKIEFHRFSDRLRIHGIILPEQLESGSHHTLNIDQGTQLRLIKDQWLPQDNIRISEAVESTRKPRIIVVSLDEDEALVGLIRQYGVQELGVVHSGRSGKQYKAQQGKDTYFDEIMSILQQHGTGMPLLISGPGFTKERFLKFIRSGYVDTFSDTALVTTGQSGKVGIHEVLKTGSLGRLIAGTRIEYETSLFERFLQELSTSGKATYGMDHVCKAVDAGAVEYLLVTDRTMRENRDIVAGLLKTGEENGAEIVVVSEDHDSGRQLQKLGGYAAILRYRIE